MHMGVSLGEPNPLLPSSLLHLFHLSSSLLHPSTIAASTLNWILSLRWWKLPELLAIIEDKVHVAVEGHELSNELMVVLDRDVHAIIDELKDLRTL
ncbi:hypothetical protein RIF29_25226 [Crotalaria pallida]|uniref:Uncharacterized protein n=1 Tax=Crotalaria pallida TaxID=3830 RepID=A0AAN9I403_CROPI